MSDYDIIDLDGSSIKNPTSVFEKASEVHGYEDLVKQMDKIEFDEYLMMGNGKSFSHEVGKQVWRIVVFGAKPKPYRNEIEREGYDRIFKIVLALANIGEYPLMQLLSNYLGISLDEFYAIVQTHTHPLREVYFWAMNVFDAAAQLNGVRANGNDAMRIWIDKTREHKVTAEDKLNFIQEQNRIDTLKGVGADIIRELIDGKGGND